VGKKRGEKEGVVVTHFALTTLPKGRGKIEKNSEQTTKKEKGVTTGRVSKTGRGKRRDACRNPKSIPNGLNCGKGL